MSARLIGFALVLALALSAQATSREAGVLPDGSNGNLHRVVAGDTLWDITSHYLGTPWIWPSIWHENTGIQNPHLIYPSELIWITAGGLRRLTEEEAARLLGRSHGPGAQDPAAPEGGAPELGQLNPSEAAGSGMHAAADWWLRFPGVERFGFISAEKFQGSGAVLPSDELRRFMSQRDEIVVSLGTGQTEAGLRYQLFRVRHRVKHPETGKMMGYFIEVLGEARVTEVHPESSFAFVTDAFAEIEPGDRVTPFRPEPTTFVPVAARDGIEGVIIAQQLYRLDSAGGDLVLLDQGLSDGVVPGNQFVVFTEGKRVKNPLAWGSVRIPDAEIGSLFVLKAAEQTSLALVTDSTAEFSPGFRFRSR
ncbi:MAG: LysM peptidoglycan-binding domain-containing protein [Myxococcales bacterium]|nr:LysM peptidoglycan-binding domain-containing protein [Myxococcales bacterium]